MNAVGRGALEARTRGKHRARGANRLLAPLSARDRRRIALCGDVVELGLDDVLHEAGTHLRHVYFPIGGCISLTTPTETSAGIEVALVGSEGMVGLPLLLGVPASALHHVVQGPGGALRIGVAAFSKELDRNRALRRRLGRYAYVNLHQLAQTAACIRFHTVEQRLARWLLMAHDRSSSDSFHATHRFLADMLGVRRAGVTNAATALQRADFIRYRRGVVTILQRGGLRQRACGCYAAASKIYDQMLG